MDSKNYQLNDAKMFADVTEGMAILINSATGIYYGMNGLGTVVYENLMEGASLSDVSDAIKDVPGVPEDYETALESFINSLLEFEILLPKDEVSSKKVVIDPAVALEDNFIPVCTEYQDVQELLFADPIHEVDAEEGWRPE